MRIYPVIFVGLSLLACGDVAASPESLRTELQQLEAKISLAEQKYDEKLSQLQDCEKASKTFKIAGIATLAGTGVGAIGNFALSQKYERAKLEKESKTSDKKTNTSVYKRASSNGISPYPEFADNTKQEDCSAGNWYKISATSGVCFPEYPCLTTMKDFCISTPIKLSDTMKKELGNIYCDGLYSITSDLENVITYKCSDNRRVSLVYKGDEKGYKDDISRLASYCEMIYGSWKPKNKEENAEKQYECEHGRNGCSLLEEVSKKMSGLISVTNCTVKMK